MIDWIQRLFDNAALAPHGQCLLWRPDLVMPHVTSDLIITIAYYSIPVVLVYFVRRRPDVSFGWVFWCFAAFILACGTTHAMAILTIWQPDYAGEGLIKAATAAASIATAGALWPLLPQASSAGCVSAHRLVTTKVILARGRIRSEVGSPASLPIALAPTRPLSAALVK